MHKTNNDTTLEDTTTFPSFIITNPSKETTASLSTAALTLQDTSADQDPMLLSWPKRYFTMAISTRVWKLF
jgi:hypothetical protein